MEEVLPEIIVNDPRVGCKGIDTADGFVGVVEKIFRFTNGEERIQLHRGDYSRCDLDPSQVQIVSKVER